MTPLVFWDASGLLKRYFVEAGSGTVDALFDAVPRAQMFATIWGYAECYAILHRKRNAGRLNDAVLAEALTSLQGEVLTGGEMKLLSIEDDRILASLTLVSRYNLNSADAAILATFVRYCLSLPPGGPACVLVAADGRLLRAAEGEGFVGLNPELVTDVGAFLSGL